MARYAGGMAKKTKRERGRPEAENPLSERVLCRLDRQTKDALDAYVAKAGLGAASTAIRVILMERLRKEGMLR